MNTGTSTVDERIVEMRIDNEKFEAGAKKTIGILESLDRSLKGLGENNVDGFEQIEQSLDKVTNRFSAFGIAGDQIMRNLTNKAMELVSQLRYMSTALTTQQIGAGWDKYAGKVEAVQTIMAATNNLVGEGLDWANQEEQLAGVTEQLERLTWFADETSYSFSDMVNNVGKFTAAGRGLEESVTAMQGISTWAAISGGRPAEAGRAMYNLSQALGLGAVTQIDWKSIELANMATYEFKQQVIDVAEKMHTLQKVSENTWETAEGHTVTLESFRENLKDKWFTSDVLLEVLNNYGGFAQLVADVQDTFEYDSATYVLKDLKNYEKMLDGDKEATEDLQASAKELGVTIDDLKVAFDEMLKPEYDLGRRAFQAAQEAKTFQEAIDATRDAVSTKWMDVFEELFGNYLEAKELWTKMSEVMWNIFARPVDHLLEVIRGSGGYLDPDGVPHEFSEGIGGAAGTTEVLEDRLAAVGKTMDDLEKAFKKTTSAIAVEEIIKGYGSFEEALKHGAFTLEQFQKALGELDDSFDSSKPTTLNRALNKVGKTAKDFEKALREAMEPKEVVRALEKYSSLEDAFRNGAISVEDFKAALNSLGIDSENVTEDIQETVKSGVGNIAQMRELALEVLRGDHGAGDKRLAWYESMGLDPELMQAMVGDLRNIARAGLDDDYLMEIMELYYQTNNLKARLGYETFAEYLASCMGSTEEYVYDMNTMSNEAEQIYASLFGSGVLDEEGQLISAGELFRKSLTNLLEALENFGDTFDTVFMKVFGGGWDRDTDQLATMSDGFFTLTAAFYSFSTKVKEISKSESLASFLEAIFSIIRIIGKTLGIVIKIAKTGLSIIFKLLSPIFNLANHIFSLIITGIDGISRTIDRSGILDIISDFGDRIVKYIEKPIDKINKVIDTLVNAFKEGFSEGGIASGLQNMMDSLDELFADHPVLLAVIHALATAFGFLKNVIAGLALALGSIFGGAVMIVVAAFQKLGEWFGQLVTWAKTSDVMTGIWTALTTAFEKFGNVVKRVYGYAEEGYAEGGFAGALSAVADSFERGVTRLVPGGEKLIEIFKSVKAAVRGLFSRKVVDENGVEQEIDTTEEELLTLEETFASRGGFFANLIRGAGGDEEAQEEVKEGVGGLVESAWQGFLEKLREIRISDVISALRLGVIANVLLKVGHGLNIINGLADNIADIPDRFNDLMKDLGQTFRSLSVNFQMTAIKQLGVGILLIAGSIWILSKIPKEEFERASSTVLAIILLLSLLIKVMMGPAALFIKQMPYFPAFGLALIGFAAIIGTIGSTALILALISRFVGTEHLKAAIIAVGAILGAIGLIMTILMVYAKKSGFDPYTFKWLGQMMKGIGLGMIGIALAVQMLMIPVLAFSLVLKFARGKAGVGKFLLAVGAVAAILGAIAVLLRVLISSVKGFRKNGQINQIGTFMIKIAASLLIMALALQMMTMPILILAAAQKVLKFNVKGIIGAFAILGAVAGMIALMLAIFGAIMSKKKAAEIKAVGNYLLKLAGSLVLMSFAMSVLTVPIIAIANLCERLDDLQILKSLGILVGILVIFSVLIGILSKVILKNNGSENASRLGEGILKIAKAIMVLSLAALFLAPAIILISGAIAAFTYVLGRMDDAHWVVFEQGLERLGKFSTKLMKFGIALGIVGLAATLTGTGIIAMAGGILLLAAAISILMVAAPNIVDAFQSLANMDWKTLGDGAGKFILILGGLLIALTMISLTAKRLSTILGGGLFARAGSGFLGAMKKIVDGMRNGVSNGFTKTIEFLKDEKNKAALLDALKVLIILGATYAAGLMPTFADVIVGGVVNLLNSVADAIRNNAEGIVDAINNIVEAACVVGAGLIDSVFGTNYMKTLNENDEALDKTRRTVLKVVGAFGLIKAAHPFELLKAVLGKGKGGGDEGVLGSLGDIIDTAGNVNDKFNTLKDLLDKDDGVIATFNKLKEVHSQTDEIMEGLTGSTESYLTTMMGAVLPYVLAAAAIAAIVKGMHDLEEGTGWWAHAGEAEKENDVEIFGEEADTAEKKVEKLEDVFARYNELLDAKEAATNAYAEASPDADLDQLLADLEAASQAVQDYSLTYQESFSRLAREISDATGEKYSTVFKQLMDGTIESNEAYQTWLESVKQAEEEAAASSRDYVAELAEMKTSIDAINDSRDRTFKSMEYSKLLEEGAAAMNITVGELRQMVDEYSQVEDSASGAATGSAEATTELTDSLSEVTTTATEATDTVSGLFDLFTNVRENGIAGIDLNSFLGSTGLDKNALASALGLDDPNAAREQLKNWFSPLGDTDWLDQVSTDDLKSIGTNIINGIADGANSSEASSGLTSVLEKYGDIIPDTLKQRLGIESPSTVMRDEVGQYIPAGIGAGIDKYWYTAVNPLYKLMDEMSYAFHNIREKFVGHGAQIVQGIIDGIQANYLAARQVAVGLADTINEGLRDELDMHSPSRTMYENGVNIVKGVSEGMSDEVSASLWGTRDISDSLTDFLYDQTKKVVKVFSILNVGAAMRMKQTRKEIFEGLGEAPEDYILALERLALKEQEVQNQIELTPKTRDDEKQRLERINQIYDQLGSVLLPELAYKLGITTEAFYAQLEAANGNIFEIKAMQEYLAQYAQTAEDLRLVDTSIPAEEATRSADNMYTGITDPFEQIDAVFDTYGAEAAYGLVRGILENIYQAYQSGSDLAAALENGFTEYLKIESPSRVFAELARYIPLGIGKGIDQESDSAISSVVVLSDALMDAIMQSMAMVSAVADEDFEFTPRITPVVDLTDVDSAASYMGGMFSENYGMSAQMSSAISKRMATAERIASNMATTQTINNGDNITFNIYQQPGEDANALADAVLARMNTRLARRGAAFG